MIDLSYFGLGYVWHSRQTDENQSIKIGLKFLMILVDGKGFVRGLKDCELHNLMVNFVKTANFKPKIFKFRLKMNFVVKSSLEFYKKSSILTENGLAPSFE